LNDISGEGTKKKLMHGHADTYVCYSPAFRELLVFKVLARDVATRLTNGINYNIPHTLNPEPLAKPGCDQDNQKTKEDYINK
jgi:hypothetical protein